MMELLARTGRRNAALSQYETCRAVLQAELGVQPGSQTSAFYERIRTMTGHQPRSLPPQATPFIGRERDLTEITTRLADPACRLLTLSGPGGIGKTRLALQAAQRKKESFLHGVAFVSLAAATPECLVASLAAALNLPPTASPDPLLSYLREKESLLVLDNYESLLPDTALLETFLVQAPLIKLLVTSRERLNLQGEWLYPMRGLAYPAETEGKAMNPMAYQAGQLFVRTAQRLHPGFSPTPADARAIGRICRWLQGLPLGVELAAAWVRLLPCTEIARRIETDPDFLSSPWRDLPARHQSLRTVFKQAWARLSAAEQALAQKLTVFQGPFSLEAAQAVVDVRPQHLLALADKSFLQQYEPGLYSLPQPLKPFLVEQLKRNQPDDGPPREVD